MMMMEREHHNAMHPSYLYSIIFNIFIVEMIFTSADIRVIAV